MIDKHFIENRIHKLENILFDLQKRLLPNNKEQYNIMAYVYIEKIEELKKLYKDEED